MANIILGGTPTTTCGTLPDNGTKASDFLLTGKDMNELSLKDFSGKKLILNIFPSVDTGVCSASVRAFNIRAAALSDTHVLCISRDLPFAQTRFCGAEGLDHVVMLSDFKTGNFGQDHGLTITGGAFDGLFARCVIVLDSHHHVVYSELVSEIGHEPNYEAAIAAASA